MGDTSLGVNVGDSFRPEATVATRRPGGLASHRDCGTRRPPLPDLI